MLFRKLANQKEELQTYKKIVRRYELLIDRIIRKCEECNATPYFRNPTIGFNSIKRLAQSNIEEIYKLEDKLFLTNDD